ncbi:hypothetical protein CAOG_05273 [Capsaspora owczarzaki ATCC 30864]|uniref:Heparinase II/III-like C-terminal domain-containing protein n=1 Tax=Capsaspora owczarzaki (strain ATCC 30864) TaxID=595528 RepID=A0A0D2WRR6_CAPO3|nr:hypothetical protein CAOG_05273 [Capsaspora owczarzaki ATCC 30864]KJE94660.1 hypothetical protein CAOG_005273 [Capsaspora owczarzaki ATCC 30864]|eukprot:XP_004346958.1 hypothetical protein CAOG_05273 [Capsaspora owczarzaki ATCC 30864]
MTSRLRLIFAGVLLFGAVIGFFLSSTLKSSSGMDSFDFVVLEEDDSDPCKRFNSLDDDSAAGVAVECLLKRPLGFLPLFDISPAPSWLPSDQTADGFELNIDLQVANVSLPVDWSMDPFHDRSWRMWLHGLNDLVAPSLRAYAQNPQTPEYLLVGKWYALDWCRKFRNTHQHTDDNGNFVWYDMAVTSRAVVLVTLMHLGAHAGPLILPLSEMRLLAQCAIVHGEFMVDTSNYLWHNHGLFCDASLYLLSDIAPWLHPDTRMWKQTAIGRFNKNGRASFDSITGVHKEHSTGYQLWMSYLLYFCDQVGLLSYTSLKAILPQMENTLTWMLTTDDAQSLPLIGDTAGENTPPKPIYTHTDGLAPEEFNRGGVAIVKQLSTSSHLFVTAWFFSCVHKHYDDLSFILTEFGRRLLVDQGRFAYFYDHPHRLYTVSGAAHNGMTVDDFKPEPCKKLGQPYGSAILLSTSNQGWTVFAGDNPILTRTQGIRHTRVFFYLPSKLLVVVDLAVPSDSSSVHQYTRHLHYDTEIALAMTDRAGYSAFVEHDGTQQQLVARVRDWSATANISSSTITLIKGQATPTLQGWTYPKLRVPVPAFVSNMRATVRGNVAFVTALQIAQPSGQVPAARLVQPVFWTQQHGAVRTVELDLVVDGVHWLLKVALAKREFEATIL